MCGVASKRRKKINIFSQSDSVCAEASTFSGAREARSWSLLTPNPLTHETTHANRFNDRMKQCTLHNEYQHSEETKKKKNRSSLMHSSTSLNFKLRSISCFNKNSPNKMLVQESTGVCKCKYTVRQILECTCVRIWICALVALAALLSTTKHSIAWHRINESSHSRGL